MDSRRWPRWRCHYAEVVRGADSADKVRECHRSRVCCQGFSYSDHIFLLPVVHLILTIKLTIATLQNSPPSNIIYATHHESPTFAPVFRPSFSQRTSWISYLSALKLWSGRPLPLKRLELTTRLTLLPLLLHTI